MYLGKIVEEASNQELYGSPCHPYTKALIAATPIPDPRLKRERMILAGDVPSSIHPPPGCRFHTRCPIKTGDCGKIEPELRDLGGGHRVACHLEKRLMKGWVTIAAYPEGIGKKENTMQGEMCSHGFCDFLADRSLLGLYAGNLSGARSSLGLIPMRSLDPVLTMDATTIGSWGISTMPFYGRNEGDSGTGESYEFVDDLTWDQTEKIKFHGGSLFCGI
jgi:oligopeptide/dipeptide ABC transporter ATP-binding protein